MNDNQREQKSLTELLDFILIESARFFKGLESDSTDLDSAIVVLRSRLAALENEAEQAAKDHEAMDVLRSKRVVSVSWMDGYDWFATILLPQITDGHKYYVTENVGKCDDPAEAILNAKEAGNES